MRILNQKLLISVAILAMVASGCAGQASTASNESAIVAVDVAPLADTSNQSADVAAQNQPLTAAGEVIVARVNQYDITEPALNRAVARFGQQMVAQDATILRDQVLTTLIDQALIEQAAATQNIQVTDAEVQTELDANKQLAGSDDAWQQWLNNNLYTEDEFRVTLHEALLTSRMRDLITTSLNGNVMHVHARHILVATEADAAGLLAQVRAGEDFATLATDFSQDVTTREQGGDLGWFAQGELLEPYLSQVAFSLQPGDVAGPVATSLGYHVLQTLEREERPVPDEKRAALAQGMFEQWLANLRNLAVIERY